MITAPKDEATDASGIADVAIIGGGFAGCLAAITLGRDGHKVVVIDLNSENPALFRAEKISGDQIGLLRELGILDDFKQASTLVVKFTNIRGRHIIDRPDVEEYCIMYPAMIELLRKKLPSNVRFMTGRVLDIHTSASVQDIVLANSKKIKARLAVLATGHSKTLQRKLGFENHKLHNIHTVCAGFTLKQPPASIMPCHGLVAYGENFGDGIDYISLFPLDSALRANLFMFSDIRDPRVNKLRTQGLPALFDILPGLRLWLQYCELAGDISVFPVELYKNDNAVRDGLVLISDAFMTSCPAVGTGLSCAITDVIRLRHHIAQWLQTPGMEATKIAEFYCDPIKIARNDSAQRLAIVRRERIMQTSLTHRLYMTVYYIARRLRDHMRIAIRSIVP